LDPSADESPVSGDGEPAKREPRLYQRREVIALVGVGGIAAGFGLSALISKGGESSSNEPRGDRPEKPAKDKPDKPDKDRGDKERGDKDRGGKDQSTSTTDPPPPEDLEPASTIATDEADGSSTGFERGLPKARWSDPDTWGGRIPGEDDIATIAKPVLLDVDAAVRGVRIESRGALVFDPATSRRLATRGNLVVAGQLVLHPADPTVVHEIQFVDVDENRFVGGHVPKPIEQDVGLWVVEAGLLDGRGAEKTAWTHLSGAAEAGDSSIDVDDATGWRVGDEIVVTPTEPTTVEDHSLHHDRRTIKAVSRQRVTLDKPLQFPHPAVTVRPGVVHRAEVLNLTRNVLIGGTPEGRSHVIFLMTSKPQHISHVGLLHMGPRHSDDQEVLGRYAIHFHGDESGSRGTVVEGVAVYDSTGHAFAAHLSDGVTFRECIAHDLVDDAFWWDLSLDGGGRDLVPSNDIVYERCVAHFVKSGANSKFNLTGFLMGAGDGNIARGCVATGIQGGAESSPGFHWPSLSRDDNTWTFEDNVAHNNRNSGIYVWQNGAPQTLIDRFTAYHCGHGIFAGSYSNLFSYRDCTIYACASNGLVISALPAKKGERTNDTITYEGMYIDQAGLSDYAVSMTKHIARGGRVTMISDSTFAGGRVAQVGLPDGGDHPQLYDFTDCTFDGNEFWLADDVSIDTILNVRDSSSGSFTVRRADQPGEYREDWNASVTT
jgi:hypothetical protein